MKKMIVFVGLLFIFEICFAQAPDWIWASQAGGVSTDYGNAIAIDSFGDIYVTGSFYGTATFGSTTLISSGDQDLFVAKMDSDGNWQWASQASGNSNICGEAIAIDGDGNIYITGYFNNSCTFGSTYLISNWSHNIFVAKMDINGNWLWASQADSGGTEEGTAITIDDNGNIFILGTFTANIQIGSTNLTCWSGRDIFVSKLDTYGTWQWATHAGGYNNDYSNGAAIVMGFNGSAYITGSFKGHSRFDSIILGSYSNLDYDIFVAKIDAEGSWQWASQASGIEDNRGNAITIDDNENIFITGDFQGTAEFATYLLTSVGGSKDIFIAKISSTGDWQWAIQASGTLENCGTAIISDGNGYQYISGYFYGTTEFGLTTLSSSGSADIFVAKTDNNGNWHWAKKANGINNDRSNANTINNNGQVYVLGKFVGSLVFDSTSLTSYGGSYDIFVAKLENDFKICFEANPTYGYYPTVEVNFTDLSLGNITAWQWDFQNDGIYDSFIQNPIFTYTETGIYDVKLKISNSNQVDSLIKYNYITVEYVPPAPPTNVQVDIIHPDAVITWTAVDTTIFGDQINVAAYLVYYCATPDSVYYFHGLTVDTTYTHNYVAQFSENMFYEVTAYVGELDILQDIIAEKPELKLGELNGLIEKRKFWGN